MLLGRLKYDSVEMYPLLLGRSEHWHGWMPLLLFGETEGCIFQTFLVPAASVFRCPGDEFQSNCDGEQTDRRSGGRLIYILNEKVVLRWKMSVKGCYVYV